MNIIKADGKIKYFRILFLIEYPLLKSMICNRFRFHFNPSVYTMQPVRHTYRLHRFHKRYDISVVISFIRYIFFLQAASDIFFHNTDMFFLLEFRFTLSLQNTSFILSEKITGKNLKKLLLRTKEIHYGKLYIFRPDRFKSERKSYFTISRRYDDENYT